MSKTFAAEAAKQKFQGQQVTNAEEMLDRESLRADIACRNLADVEEHLRKTRADLSRLIEEVAEKNAKIETVEKYTQTIQLGMQARHANIMQTLNILKVAEGLTWALWKRIPRLLEMIAVTGVIPGYLYELPEQPAEFTKAHAFVCFLGSLNALVLRPLEICGRAPPEF